MKIIKNNSNIYFISTLWEISSGIFDTIFFILKSHKQRQWFVDVLQNMCFEKTFEFSQENTELFDELFDGDMRVDHSDVTASARK